MLSTCTIAVLCADDGHTHIKKVVAVASHIDGAVLGCWGRPGQHCAADLRAPTSAARQHSNVETRRQGTAMVAELYGC